MSEGSSAAAKGCVVAVFLLVVLAVVGAAAFWMMRAPSSNAPVVTAPTAPPTPGDPVPSPSGGALTRIKSRGRLLVGMDTGEPPMSGTPPMFFVDAQGGRDGLDYALARRIADTLGVPEVEIVHAKYSAIEDLLLDTTPKIDVLVSGYSPTDTPGIKWSAPYLEYGLCLVVPAKSSVRTTADLTGKAVGIFDDDAAAAEVQRLVKGYTGLVRMEDGYWDALLAGRFAGFLYDYPYAAAELQKWYGEHPDRRGAFRIAQYNLTDSTYAVGVRASEPDLLLMTDQAIASWRASDDYAAAVRRYLKGGEATAVVDPKARTIVVQKGDTLSGIAKRELGDTDRWKELWAKNRSRFPNPHLIEVGDLVELP
jgi:ABC-type amino acid transport substrate-binding protein